MPQDEIFLVTGALGCIGAWVVRKLIDAGSRVITLDASADDHRLRLLMEPAELDRLASERCDITNLEHVERVLDRHGVTNVIHLAALQVPACRSDPPRGASVNVVGTINVFESVARRIERMAPVVYASSIAAYDDEVDDGHPATADGGFPGTLYGVYKRANEGAATVFFRDRGLPSIGLRPHTVYGLGRDQGLTASPTTAMLAAAAQLPYHVPYGGRFQLQYAPDVASAFIQASRAMTAGASVHNIGGSTVDMADVVELIEMAAPAAAGLITFGDRPLPFPAEVESRSLVDVAGEIAHIPVQLGVAQTIDRFRELLSQGRIATSAIEAGGA
jgi:UDP-glucuronate 4-epimerase